MSDPVLVAAVQREIEQAIPDLHTSDCICYARSADESRCIDQRIALATLLASWVGPLEEAITADDHGAPHCRLCGLWADPGKQIRHRPTCPLAVLPWRKETP